MNGSSPTGDNQEDANKLAWKAEYEKEGRERLFPDGKGGIEPVKISFSLSEVLLSNF